MEACVRLPVIQTESRLGPADSGIALADRRLPRTYKSFGRRRSGLSAPAGAKKPRRGVDEGCGKA